MSIGLAVLLRRPDRNTPTGFRWQTAVMTANSLAIVAMIPDGMARHWSQVGRSLIAFYRR